MPITRLQAAGNAKASPGKLKSVLLSAGADAASATIVNATSGTTPIVATLRAPIGTSVQWTPDPDDGEAAFFDVGIRVGAITGTTPDIVVCYE